MADTRVTPDERWYARYRREIEGRTKLDPAKFSAHYEIALDEYRVIHPDRPGRFWSIPANFIEWEDQEWTGALRELQRRRKAGEMS